MKVRMLFALTLIAANASYAEDLSFQSQYQSNINSELKTKKERALKIKENALLGLDLSAKGRSSINIANAKIQEATVALKTPGKKGWTGHYDCVRKVTRCHSGNISDNCSNTRTYRSTQTKHYVTNGISGGYKSYSLPKSGNYDRESHICSLQTVTFDK